MTLEKEKILIIVPTYNEKKNICILLERIIRTVREADILVVDDNSPDGTALEVKNFASTSHANIRIIERKGKRGLGDAYRAGFQYGLNGGYDILVTMDGDLSHNPSYLPLILSAIKYNDVVVGSRYIKDGGTVNWRIRRILLSWLANKFARFLLGLKGNDLTSGYRAYRRSLLESIGLNTVKSNGYSFLVEMLFFAKQKNVRVHEVPIIFFDRIMGKSKISRKEIFLGALTLFRLRLNFSKDEK